MMTKTQGLQQRVKPSTWGVAYAMHLCYASQHQQRIGRMSKQLQDRYHSGVTPKYSMQSHASICCCLECLSYMAVAWKLGRHDVAHPNSHTFWQNTMAAYPCWQLC